MLKAPAHFALRIALPVLIICGLQPSVLLAQQPPARFALRLQRGVAVMPLQAWEEISDVIVLTGDANPPPDFFGGAAIAFRLAPGHTMSLEVEYLTNAISVSRWQIEINDTGTVIGEPFLVQDNGTFTLMPVTLNYTRHFSIKAGSWSPYIGVGVSYYRTAVYGGFQFPIFNPQGLSSVANNGSPYMGVGRSYYPTAARSTPGYPFDPHALSSQPGVRPPRYGTGYGLALAAGAEFPLSGHLYLINQLRFRWANGNASDELSFIRVSVNGYDLSMGLSWHF